MNILFIPHVPNTTVINRVYEFAKVTNNYFLTWEMDNSSLKHKIFSQLHSLQYKRDGKNIQIPLLFKPQNLATKFNTLMLNNLIDKLNIEVVINANALLFDVKNIKVPVIYDLVDDHLEVNNSIGLTQQRVQKIKEDIKHSKGVICVTKFIEQKVKKFHANTITIENGVYLERFEKAKSLKKELGLEGKKVFGYIGGVEEWTGIDKACEAYLKIQNETNAMIVVGGSQSRFFRILQERYQKDISFIGTVSPEKVGNYFKTLDVGLIPFQLNDFTHNAFPIKALEYGLVRARVISTPLHGLMEKKFPFISFSPIEQFTQAMKDISTEKFAYDFDKYDWKFQSQKILNFVKVNTNV